MDLGKRSPLRIETDHSEAPSQELRFSLDTTSPFTPVGTRAPEVPSFRLSTPTSDATASIAAINPFKPTSTNRARGEGRKLLAHVLTQLHNRTMPPSVSDAIGTFHEENRSTWNLKEAVKAQIVKLDRGQRGSEDSDDEGQGYSTNATFNLMLQLQELLVMSLEQHWDIFDDYGSPQDPMLSDKNKSPSAFRRSRSSFVGGKKLRSVSPSRRIHPVASELLALCISVLASVVADDCRFQTNSPRPFCPPNALQALALNVAQVLLHINAHDPRIISQIGLAVVPAFATFNKEMYPRLISFFDHGIIRNSLARLRRLQGFEASQSTIDGSVDHPLVSIHVDEVVEDNARGYGHSLWDPWSSTGKTLKIQSTNAPAQPLPVYYLSSVIPPLLGSILDNIDPEVLDDREFWVTKALQSLLETIVDQKVDAYSDILEVVGYHAPRARKFGAFLLSSFWPQSVGHVVISRPPVNWSSRRLLSPDNAPYQHQFVPWHFKHRHDWFSPGDSSQYDCHVCKKPIHGFGLLCSYCTCMVHFDCYDHPEGSALIHYVIASDSHIQRVAIYRYSKVHASPPDARATGIGNAAPHMFQRVNLFSLALCFVCRLPLWGCTSQGLKCDRCSQLVHNHCSNDSGPCESAKIGSRDLTIKWSALRQSCFEKYRNILSFTHQDLARMSYEEITIFSDLLSTQLHILNNGLALGSILVSHKTKSIEDDRHGISEFELHRTVNWCEELLSTGTLYASPAVEEYLQENRLHRRDHSMLYTWSSLIYVSASMKLPSTAVNPSHSTSSDFLNVAQADLHTDAAEEVSHPFNMVSLSHMRDVLGHEFHIYSDDAAQVLLSHLHLLAFFDSRDEETFFNLPNMQKNKNQSCSFPLPLGLDMSIDVEVLVSAIEACLSDVDLFVNEFGFLLLTRRMWPDGLMSDYGLERLARAVFAWIINEEGHMAIILRDYLGRDKPLPGMLVNRLANQWPPVHHERPVHGGSMQNGGDYLASRQALVQRYAKRWLLALHNQDVALYANSLFSACDELAERGMVINANDSDYLASTQKDRVVQCERVLHHIWRLGQAHVLFSVSDSIYLRWLDLAYSRDILGKDASMPALLKLFPRSLDRRPTSMVLSVTGEFLEKSSGIEMDPWQVILNTSQESKQGLAKGLAWLNLLCRSGVEVPLNVYAQLVAELAAVGNPLKESCFFIRAMTASLWLRSLGLHQHQTLLAKFHLSLVSDIHKGLQQAETRSIVYDIVRHTFASCLLLYGCERTRIVTVGLISDEFISTLPSRRKLSRETTTVETILVDPAVMKAIDLYLGMDSEDIITMIAQFLYTFLASPSLLETHEMDNFILRNEGLLSKCAWQFYDIQRQEISTIRISILLRILSVDAEQFQKLLQEGLSQNQEWEKRTLAASRLFRVIQDVCSPAFNVDGRQWKSSIVSVFQSFFSLLWSDSREQVRLVVKAHCSSLLPTHLEAIASCFDETILKSPIADRIRLASFLIQLRVHFPNWQVLSWDATLEVMAENSEYDQQIYQDGETSPDGQVGLDPELAKLKVSLMALSLDALSNGIKADSLTLIKIKAQLVRIFGFQNVSIVPTGTNGRGFYLAYSEIKTVPESAYPCFGKLVSLLDSWHKIELPASIIGSHSQGDDKHIEVLIGTMYADILLNLLVTYEEILELPVLMIKHVLEAAHVVVYKHDFENRSLNVFSSQLFRKMITKALDILEADVPYEVRQVALSLVQAFVRKSTNLTTQGLLNGAERILKLITAQVNQPSQDSLVDQESSFIEDMFNKYSKSGLFINFLKRSLQKELFPTLKRVLESPKNTSLKDDLIWDTFLRLQEAENNMLPNLLNNLQQFVEVVHRENYSTELMGFAGKQLTQLAQRMSDGSGQSFDASPLLNIPATLLKHNKAKGKDLLPYLDTLLRVTLTRLQVDSQSVSTLLLATASLRWRNQVQDTVPIADAIVPTVFEVLGDGLKMKTRLLPSTLSSILEALTTTEISPSVTLVTLYTSMFISLVDGAYHWLDNYYWVEGQTEQDFHTSLVVAKMILQATVYDRTVLQRLSIGSEKHGRFQLHLRSWNILAIAALSYTKDSFAVAQLLKQLDSFSTRYFNALWPYTKPSGPVPDSATAEINQAYLSIKLWLMIAKQSEEALKIGETVFHSVWNELWPPFESIVTVLEVEAESGVSPIMAGFVASSIADLFLFIQGLRIPLSLQKSSQKAMLKRLQNLVKGESILTKLDRAIGGLTDTLPEVSLETLIDQAAKDIIATEKLRLLDLRHEPIRSTGDRRANVAGKAPTDRLHWKDVKPHA